MCRSRDGKELRRRRDSRRWRRPQRAPPWAARSAAQSRHRSSLFRRGCVATHARRAAGIPPHLSALESSREAQFTGQIALQRLSDRFRRHAAFQYHVALAKVPSQHALHAFLVAGPVQRTQSAAPIDYDQHGTNGRRKTIEFELHRKYRVVHGKSFEGSTGAAKRRARQHSLNARYGAPTAYS